MNNEHELNGTNDTIEHKAHGRTFRRKLITAGLNLFVGFAVALVTLGFGAIAVDWVASDHSSYLQVGLWLLIPGIVLCFVYMFLFALFGD